MAQAAQLPIISQYTAYKPRPFTRQERHTTTILYGGLTWKHERGGRICNPRSKSLTRLKTACPRSPRKLSSTVSARLPISDSCPTRNIPPRL